VINKALLIIMSSFVSLEAMFVWRLFADGKLTASWANLLCNTVVRQSEGILSLSDMGLRFHSLFCLPGNVWVPLLPSVMSSVLSFH